MNFKHNVFISYHRGDSSFVDFFVQTLECFGIDCFRDTTGLRVYEKLDASLKSAISQSRWLIAMISPSYLQSYWCLFEAIESIQGQDFDQRFLPMVLRYDPSDQSLDESFVLRALHDLDEQINEFEGQIIKLKAFDLSAKLDKLQFVRTNLPKVFRQINERIFPEFSLWDERSVQDTLLQVLVRISPDPVDPVLLKSIRVDFRRLAPTPRVAPRVSELPSLLWKARVGCQAWKNRVVPVGNQLVVSSSGSVWNEPDADDGIYCLDTRSGQQQWFLQTPADANCLIVYKGIVVTGCDDGTVVAASLRTGRSLWNSKLSSGVVGGPIALPSVDTGHPLGRPEDLGSIGIPLSMEDRVFVATYSGWVYIIDLRTGEKIRELNLGFNIIAEPLRIPANGRTVLVSGVDGTMCFVDVGGAGISRLDVDSSIAVVQEGEKLGLAGQAVESKGVILQGMVRDSYDRDPPLIAIDATTRRLLWVAEDPRRIGGSSGNIRSQPAIVGGQAIIATAYSNSICAVSMTDGTVTWRIPVGREMYAQYSSPVARGDVVYIGRQDGYLHKVSCGKQRREWSMFLGDPENAGAVVSASQPLPELDEEAAWSTISAPIVSTPTLDGDRLYVGTNDGYLYCIGSLGDDLDPHSQLPRRDSL